MKTVPVGGRMNLQQNVETPMITIATAQTEQDPSKAMTTEISKPIINVDNVDFTGQNAL
jgi:hypothetical protein